MICKGKYIKQIRVMAKVQYFPATWLKCKLVIGLVQNRSPLIERLLSYMCTQPPCIFPNIQVL